MNANLEGREGSLSGIRVEGQGPGTGGATSSNGIVIRNGTLTGWGQGGLTSIAGPKVIEDLIATHNTGDGIQTLFGTTVRRCTVTNNTGAGLRVNLGSQVSDCSATRNSIGIDATGECLLWNCSATSNLVSGFEVGFKCHAHHCTSTNNGQPNSSQPTATVADGFVIKGALTTVEDCTSFFNTRHGFRALSTTLKFVLVRNTAMQNGGGNYSAIGSGVVAGPVVTGATAGSATNPLSNYSD